MSLRGLGTTPQGGAPRELSVATAAPPSQAPPPTAHRSGALDGLRGFAALAVVSCHLSVSLGLLPYDTGGFIGVLVFFVLSGYLITAACWRAPGSWASYRTFLHRRVQRLAPVVLALVVLGTPAMVLWGRQPLREALTSAGLAASQLTGLAIPLGLPWHPAWAPTWSLTVEWTFYLAFPLVVLAAKRLAVSPLVMRNTTAGLALLLYAGGTLLDPQSFYLLPVANLGVMLSGAALALSHHSRRPGTRPREDSPWPLFCLGLLLLIVLMPGKSLGVGYKLVTLPLVTMAAMVVIDGCTRRGSVSRVLGWRVLPALGIRAYSLYLWHMPVFWLVWVNAPHGLPKGLVAGLGLLCLVPVVGLSYWFLERPWLNRRPRSTTPTVTPG